MVNKPMTLADRITRLPHMAHPQLRPFLTNLAERAQRGDLTVDEALDMIAVAMKAAGINDLDIEFAVHPTPIVGHGESPHMANDPKASQKGSINYHFHQIIAEKTRKKLH